MALCQPCRHALSFGDFSLVWTSTPIHITPWSFLAAVDEGCHICHGFYIQISREWRQEFRRRVEMSKSSAEERRRLDDPEELMTWYFRPRDQTRAGDIILNLERIRRIVDPSAQKILYDKLRLKQDLLPVVTDPLIWTVTSLSTNSEETFTKIKAWLSKCMKTHSKCRLRADKADAQWHPTRLVQIISEPESSDNSTNLRCRVVVSKSEDVPQNLKYITLSHRWPQDLKGFPKLTVDTLPLWKDNLPVKVLSKTFHDAFLAAQRLGISYVWIDSLCIIQEGDDYADWRREAPMMQKVYSNAELNICASKNDQQQGLFSQRTPSDYQPLKIELPRLEKDNGHYIIRNDWDDAMEVWEAKVNDSPLASRGWVFQEQLLCRANVHFGDHEVLFECLEMRASESLGSDQDYDWRLQWYHRFFKERLPIPAGIEEGLESSVESSGLADYYHKSIIKPNEYEAWHGLLSQYTMLQLTVTSDRLVALSGVAQYFKNVFPHNNFYIAGLWRNGLVTEMAWQLTNGASRQNWTKRKELRHYLTFSWASVEGKVENWASPDDDHGISTYLAELEPIKYRKSPVATDDTGDEEQPFTEDIFSLPSAPIVEIRSTGLLRPTSLERHTAPETMDGLDEDLHLFLDVLGNHQLVGGQSRLDFEMTSSELIALNKPGRLFSMPLLGFEGHFVWLLLLELVETSDGKDMGRFRRIGLHQCQYHEPVSKWLTENWFSEHSFSELPCWRYDELSKKHTIFVI